MQVKLKYKCRPSTEWPQKTGADRANVAHEDRLLFSTIPFVSCLLVLGTGGAQKRSASILAPSVTVMLLRYNHDAGDVEPASVNVFRSMALFSELQHAYYDGIVR